MSKNSKGKQVQTYDKTAILGFVFTQNALKNLFATLAYKAITRIALSLSLSLLALVANLWVKFKGLFTHFIVVLSRFILDFAHFIAISSHLVANFSYFIVVLSRIFAYKRHFLGHCAFLKFLNALFLGFCALFVILSLLQKGDPTGCKVQSHKSALNSLLKLNFRLR